MDIVKFRTAPLSDRIVTALIRATKAQSEWKAIIKYCSPSNAVKDLLTLSESFFHAMLKGLPCHFDDVLLNLFSGDATNKALNATSIFRKSMSYAKRKFTDIEVLTAADLLKINEALNELDAKILDDENPPPIPSVLVNDIWDILFDLYSPDKHNLLVLEAVIASYRLLTLQPQWKVDLWTLCVLFETVFPDKLDISGISLQWMTLMNPEKTLFDYDAENAILLILTVFENSWMRNCEMYIAVQEKKKAIQNTLQNELPKLCQVRIQSVITDNLCLNPASFREKTGVSHGTSVNYLESLEQAGIFRSRKVGREHLYFNEVICDIFREQ